MEISAGVDELSALFLRIFRLFRVDPFGPRAVRNTTVALLMVLMLYVSVLGLIEIVVEVRGLDALANIIQMFGIYLQFSSKLVWFVIKNESICKLLEEMWRHFWNLDYCGDHLEAELRRRTRFIKNATKAYFVVGVVTVCVFFGRPIILRERELSFPVYNLMDLDVTAYFVTMQCVQTFISAFCVTFVQAVDTLYLVVMVRIWCQLKMLKYAFRNLDIEAIESDRDEYDCYDRLKTYVAHHDVLLRFLKNVNTTFSQIMLGQFLVSTVSVCLSIYFFKEEGSLSIYNTIKSITFVGIFIAQLVLYCVAGDKVTEVALDVSWGVFECPWHTKNINKIRRAIHFVILRSQACKVSAGGIFDINVLNFLMVMKTSISFYTLLQTVKRKNNYELN